MTTAHPPSIHHTSTVLPPRQALSLLTAYLTATAADPSLHPHAHLTEHGPIAPSNTGLVLHNLRRVEAGLRGENLGEDLTALGDKLGAGGGRGGGEGKDGGFLPRSTTTTTTMIDDDDGVVLANEDADADAGEGHVHRHHHHRRGNTVLEEQKQGAVEAMEGEWQDKSEFERQQEVVQGDVGKRDNAVERGVEEDGEGYVPHVKATWGPDDIAAIRDAKKKAKKERKKKEQMRRTARKQREKDAEQG